MVEMLMYLAQNSRPDIAYAAHRCAQFTHALRKSHVIGTKIILRYPQGTKDKGLITNPSTKIQVDCYIDADFVDVWKVEKIKVHYVLNHALIIALCSWDVLSPGSVRFKIKYH